MALRWNQRGELVDAVRGYNILREEDMRWLTSYLVA